MSNTTQTPMRKALMTLGDEHVAVRLDDAGFLRRVTRKVRLQYGTELYCAARPGSETVTEKVAPYQPGYMKLVAAMGGQLVCPPTVRDPETGAPRANPLVEAHPDTGIIRRVTATAVCAVRNPMTGEPVVSVQTIVYDSEHVLRQALMKIADPAVQIMSAEEVAEERAAGNLKGHAILPLAPPYAMIVANMKMDSVRNAWSTFMNQSATARQRACSKAERLAADHNPVTRMTLSFGQLTPELDAQGNVCGPSYTDVTAVAWVEQHDHGAMTRLIEQLSRLGEGAVADQAQLLTAPTIDVSVDEVEDDEDVADVTPAPHRVQPTQRRVEPVPERTAHPEPKPAPAQRTQQTRPVQAEPDRHPAPALALAPSPELDRVLSRVVDLEAELSSPVVAEVRAGLGIDSPEAVTDVDTLRTYQGALAKALNGGGR